MCGASVRSVSARGVSARGVSVRGVSVRGVSVRGGAPARGAVSALRSVRSGRSAFSPRGARGARGSRGSRGSLTVAAAATGAGAATAADGASTGVASAAADFFGRPRGFFTGASSWAADGFGAVTTAAGASPLSLYGLGSSPCAVVRGERGPRPSAGRRRSVMEFLCCVVTGHGSVRNHRRARRTHGGVASSGNHDFTSHAIWIDARACNSQ